MHLPWMSQASNQQYVSKFMDYVLAKDDVWVSGLRGVNRNGWLLC